MEISEIIIFQTKKKKKKIIVAKQNKRMYLSLNAIVQWI